MTNETKLSKRVIPPQQIIQSKQTSSTTTKQQQQQNHTEPVTSPGRPPKEYLKKNARWGIITEKISKPGEEPKHAVYKPPSSKIRESIVQRKVENYDSKSENNVEVTVLAPKRNVFSQNEPEEEQQFGDDQEWNESPEFVEEVQNVETVDEEEKEEEVIQDNSHLQDQKIKFEEPSFILSPSRTYISKNVARKYEQQKQQMNIIPQKKTIESDEEESDHEQENKKLTLLQPKKRTETAKLIEEIVSPLPRKIYESKNSTVQLKPVDEESSDEDDQQKNANETTSDEESQENEAYSDENENWDTINPYNNILTSPNQISSRTTQRPPVANNLQNKKPIANSQVSNVVKSYFMPGQQEVEKKEKELQKWKEDKQKEEQSKEEEKKRKELEEQLGFFKTENDKIKKTKEDLAKERQILENEKTEFRINKEKEIKEFEEFRDSELSKIRKERKVLEKQAKDLVVSASLKDHQKELENLKNSIAKISSESRQKEEKWKAERKLLKSRIADLEAKNAELVEQLKRTETQYLETIFAAQQEQKSQQEQKPKERKVEEKKADVKPVVIVENSNPKVEVKRYDAAKEKPKEVKMAKNVRIVEPVKVEESEDELSEEEDEFENANLSNHVSQLKQIYVEDEDDSQDLVLKYEEEPPKNRIKQRNDLGGNRVETVYSNGTSLITYPNGTRKKSFANGTSVVYFGNDDIKQMYPSGKIVYYYASADTKHVTYPNKLEIFYFSNSQTERHYPDGTKEIYFPDGTTKYIHSEIEEIHFSDGTIQKTSSETGKKIIIHTDGKVESTRPNGKKKTVK